MTRFTSAVALGLAASVAAQSASVTSSAAASVISVFLLDSDPQSLVGSLIGQSNGIRTLAIQCAPGVAANDCGYPTPITITAGPSTIHARANDGSITAEYGCDITSSTTGACSVTYIGAASDLADDPSVASTATGVTTISTSGPISASDITYYAITLTAGAGVSNVASSATSTRSGSSTSGSASGSTTLSGTRSSSAVSGSSTASSAGTSRTSGTAGTTSASTTASAAGADKLVIPGFIAAALLGLAAIL